jgi:hypothetical protein
VESLAILIVSPHIPELTAELVKVGFVKLDDSGFSFQKQSK